MSLQESILRLHKINGQLFLPDIEAEVINFTCVQLFKDNRTEIIDIIDYVSKYCEIAESLFPEYNSSHSNVAQMSVIQNMEWAGMRNFLKEYYFKNHNISINI